MARMNKKRTRRPKAPLPSQKDYAKSLRLREVLKRTWNEYKHNGGIPHEEFWRIVAK
jgi:hypothetical protein